METETFKSLAHWRGTRTLCPNKHFQNSRSCSWKKNSTKPHWVRISGSGYYVSLRIMEMYSLFLSLCSIPECLSKNGCLQKLAYCFSVPLQISIPKWLKDFSRLFQGPLYSIHQSNSSWIHFFACTNLLLSRKFGTSTYVMLLILLPRKRPNFHNVREPQILAKACFLFLPDTRQQESLWDKIRFITFVIRRLEPK